MKFRPLNDYVFARRLKNDKETTASGLYIPDAAKEKLQEAEVFAVGPGKRYTESRLPLLVKVGDRILFGKWGGVEAQVDGEDYLLLHEDEILGILT